MTQETYRLMVLMALIKAGASQDTLKIMGSKEWERSLQDIGGGYSREELFQILMDWIDNDFRYGLNNDGITDEHLKEAFQFVNDLYDNGVIIPRFIGLS